MNNISRHDFDCVKEEVKWLLRARFIKLIRYIKWIFKKVPVLKKNGRLKICIDFKNTSLTTIKDEYNISMDDILIDVALENEVLHFINGHSSYNQTFIAEEDVSKT